MGNKMKWDTHKSLRSALHFRRVTCYLLHFVSEWNGKKFTSTIKWRWNTWLKCNISIKGIYYDQPFQNYLLICINEKSLVVANPIKRLTMYLTKSLKWKISLKVLAKKHSENNAIAIQQKFKPSIYIKLPRFFKGHLLCKTILTATKVKLERLKAHRFLSQHLIIKILHITWASCLISSWYDNTS